MLKVKTTINHDDLKKRAIEKHSHHKQSFCDLEEYVLLHTDGKEALFCLESLAPDFNLTPTGKS